MTSLQRSLVWSLGFCQCISWGILFYAFSAILPAMTQTLALSHEALSFMATLSALIAAVIALPVGRRLDEGRHLRVMMFGSLIAAVGCGIWSFSSSMLGLYTAALFLGLGQATTLYEPVFVFLLHVFPVEEERHAAMMKVTVLGGLASPIFLPLITLLIDAMGWPAALRVLAGCLLIPAIVYLFWQTRKIPVSLQVEGQSVARTVSFSFDFSFLAAAQRPLLLVLTLVFLMNAIVHTALMIHVPSALQSWGFGAYEAAWAVGIMGAAQLLGRLGPASYLREFRKRSLLALPMAVMGMMLFFLVLSRGLPTSWIVLMVIGASSGLLTLLRPALVSLLFEARVFGKVNGLLALVYQLARAAGPIGGSLLLGVWQGYAGVFLVLAGLMLAASVLSLRLRALH